MKRNPLLRKWLMARGKKRAEHQARADAILLKRAELEKGRELRPDEIERLKELRGKNRASKWAQGGKRD